MTWNEHMVSDFTIETEDLFGKLWRMYNP